ncbi:MAG: outer membrane lipoprotein carrier protein LolA [Thermoanaerobaculia bacterium]
MRIHRHLGSLALWLAVPALAQAASSAPDPRSPGLSPRDRLSTLIERVKLEQQQVKTLEAAFVQRQESTFLVKPEESHGVFSYQAPDMIRWEYESPRPITMLIDGKSMSTWYRDLGRVDQMKIGRYSEKILKYLGASGSIETLLQYFDVQLAMPNDPTAPYRLDMKPRFDRVSKRLRALTLWVDARQWVPSKLRYETPDGGVTEFSFQNLKVNSQLPGGRFHLDLPQGVQVRVIDLDRGTGTKP